MSPLDTALHLARAGFSVYPIHTMAGARCTCGDPKCSKPAKHPRTAHGRNDATTEETKIREWFARWPDSNYAIATGMESRLLVLVLDIDPRHGGDTELARLEAAHGALPATFTVLTGGGGRHLYYRRPASVAGVKIPSRPLPGYSGIDVLADGGGAIAPGSRHASGNLYRVEPDSSRELTELPAAVVDLIVRQPPSPKPLPPSRPRSSDGSSPYGLAALKEEAAGLRVTAEGGRNSALNRAAFAVAQLVAGGELDAGEAEREILSAAADAGLADGEAQTTFRSGFTAGLAEPRSAPPVAAAPEPPRPSDGPDDRPPLPEEAPEDVADVETPDDWSQDSLALDLTRSWGEARHVALWGKWLFWAGTHWQEDERLSHMTRARDYLRRRAEDLLGHDQKAKRPADNIRSAKTVAAVVGLARSNQDVAAGVEDWDKDPFLLGTPGGTVDLTTGELRPARPEEGITKLTSCAPAPKGTRSVAWEYFIHEITNGREELAANLKRLCGYALTGSVREHAICFAYGSGTNGKSVFVGTIAGVMHDYAAAIPAEMLMVSTGDRHPADVARLRGVRLAIGSETEDGRQWAEAKVKALTGGDRIPARFMRQDWFEFSPAFKIIVCGNHSPSLRGVDKAIRRRLHLLPFDFTVPDGKIDKNLGEKLAAEGPAILRWAIDGCIEWQQRGLDPPPCIREATDKYLADEDVILRWIEAAGEFSPASWQSAAELWTSWKRFAEKAGEDVGTQRRFAVRLVEHGLIPDKRSHAGGRGYLGLKLTHPPVEEDCRYGD
jgi:P4 family phage/plasmid primase-like protien